jgi:hypothetical protein
MSFVTRGMSQKGNFNYRKMWTEFLRGLFYLTYLQQPSETNNRCQESLDLYEYIHSSIHLGIALNYSCGSILVVGWITMLHAGKSRVPVPYETIAFFLNLPNRIMALGFTQLLTAVPGIFLGVKRGRCVGLTTSLLFVSRLSRICGGLDIAQLYGLPRPVTGIT